MPQYDISVPGRGTYRVESPTDLTDAQVWAAVQSQLAAPPSTKRTWGEAATDVGAGLVSGVGSLVQLPGQLYGLATGNFDDSGALGAGNAISKYGESLKSEGLQAREAASKIKVEESEKQNGQFSAFLTQAKEVLSDPAQLSSFLATQLPQLVLPGGAAKMVAGKVFASTLEHGAAAGLSAAAAKEAAQKAAIAAGTAAAKGTGAVMQGADIGAGAYQQVYDKAVEKGMPKEKAAEIAISMARASGVNAAGISWLAQSLPGASALEAKFAGKAGAGRLATGLGEAYSEMAEEVPGKMLQNLSLQQVDPEQKLMQGTGSTGALAAVGGLGMGTAMGGPGHAADVAQAEALKAKQAAQQAAREADALKAQEAEAAKQTPEYAKQVVDNYTALEQQRLALQGQLKNNPKTSPTYAADAETNKQLQIQIADLKRQARELAPEYNALKDKVPAPPPAETPAAEGKPQDLFGEAPVQPEAPAVPEVPMEVRRDELAQQIRLLPTLLEQHRDAAAKAATPEEALQHVAKFDEVQQAIAKATEEHAQLPQLPAPNTLQKQLESQQTKLAKAQELGDTEAISRAATRILELRDLGATQGIISSKTTKAPWGSETTESFNQRVIGPEMAVGREAAEAQRKKVADEQAALQRIAAKPVDNVYPEVRKEKMAGNEIAQMEKARINPLKTEQLTIPGTALPLESKVVRGAGTPATKTEAEFKLDYAAAKETKNRPAMLAAIEGIRDARDRATNETPEGAATRDLAAIEPANPVRARGQALVQLLQAKPEDVEAARGRLLERLAADIEDARGKPLPQSQRYALAAEANPVLDTLLKSAKQMLDAKKAQAALDAIRNRLAKRERGVTVDTSFAKEAAEEAQAALEPDTKTIDMFPEEKKAAEQRAATEAEYNKLFAPKVKESQADREARDAQTRIQEQKTAENLAELPGVRVSHEAYRVALEELEEAPVRVAELLRKGNDATLPKTTRDKAKRQVKALNQRVILASGMLSHDGAKMAAAKGKVEEQLAKVREKIDNKRAAAEEEGLKKSTMQSRRRELSKLVQEERNLNKLNRSLENRAKITPIKTSEDTRAAAEDRAAEKFLEQQLALQDEGTTGKLPARKLGPLTKKAVQAGNVRTGELGTVEDRQLPARNKIAQSGATRQVTSKQAVRAAEKDAEVMARKAAQEELAAANKKPPAKTRAERAIEESDFADESAYDEGGYKDFNPDAWGGEGEASLYRTSKQTGPTMPLAMLRKLAERATEGYKVLPKTEVVQSETDLPQRIQDQMARDKANGEVPGLYDPDTKTMYLIADNVRSARDAVLTVAHEVAGHFGLREMLGSDYASVMKRMYENKDVKAAADTRMKKNPALSREVAVEEVLAARAESETKSAGILRELYYRIKEWAHKTFGLGGVTDREVETLVNNALKHVQTGEGKRGGAAGAAEAVYRTKAPNYGDYADTPIAGKQQEKDTRSFYDRTFDGAALATEYNIVDMHAPAIAALRMAGAAAKNTHDARQAEYALRDAAKSNTLVEAFMGGGAAELRTDEKGFREIVASDANSGADFFRAARSIPGEDANAKFAMLTNYMKAIRGLRVGPEKVGEGNTRESLQAIIDQVEADHKLKAGLEEARAAYNAYNNPLVKMVVASGEFSPAFGEELLRHQDYVPLYRNRDGKLEMVLGDNRYVSMGDIANTPYLHALKGGKEAILPINESIFHNTKLLTDMALVNMSKRNMGYVLRDAGAAAKKMHVNHTRPLQGKDILSWREAPKDKDDTGERWLRIDTEDTILSGIPTMLLAQSIEGFHATMPAYLMWAQKANDWLRAGVTRMPTYTLRQLLKDSYSAALVTGMNGGPLLAVARAFKEYGKAMFSNMDSLKEVERRGLVQNNLFTGEQDDMIALTKQMAGGDAPNAVRKVLNFLDKSARAADAATRIQIFNDGKARGLSDVEASARTLESMNYHKRGAAASVQHANRALIFFNSGIQALNVSAKALQGKMPFEEEFKVLQNFINQAMLLVVGGFLYTAGMDDDDEYKKLKMTDKVGNIHIPIGDGNFLKLPVSYFEGGGAAWAAGQAIRALMDDSAEDTAIAKAWGKYARNALPGGGGIPMLPGLKQAIEWGTNTDLRTLQSIVPRGQENRTGDQQFSSTTPELYKSLAEVTGLSAAKMQHAVNTLVGQSVDAAFTILDRVAPSGNVEKPALGLEKTPFLSTLFQNPGSSEAVEEMFGDAADAVKAKGSFDAMKREGRSAEDIKRYLEKHKAEIAMGPAAQQFMKQIGELSTKIKQVENAPKDAYSAERKTEIVKAMKKRQAELAENYHKAFQRVASATT